MKKMTLITLLLLSANLWAKAKIESVDLVDVSPAMAQIKVVFDQKLAEDPSLTLKENLIQIEVKDVIVWPKIEKKVNYFAQKDVTMMAYQFDSTLGRVRVLLPYSTSILEGKVKMSVDGRVVKVDFPKLNPLESVTSVAPALQKTQESNYDEILLEQLLKDKNQKPLQEKTKKAKEDSDTTTDKINTALSSLMKNDTGSTNGNAVPSLSDTKPSQEGSGQFSLVKYFVKFVIFLTFVMGLFYGIAYLMRKGILKKGKLGFLNETNVVSVLNTTYVGPKRSLLLVKAHNQVFLLSSSERGIDFLSEVKDVPGIIRDGEKAVTGSNFDQFLSTENTATTTFSLKENIEESAPVDQNLLTKKERSKFSEHIKTKIKGLKPLQ